MPAGVRIRAEVGRRGKPEMRRDRRGDEKSEGGGEEGHIALPLRSTRSIVSGEAVASA